MTDDEWMQDGVLNINHTLTHDEFLRVEAEDCEDAVYLRRDDDGKIEIYRRTDSPENGSRPVSATLASCVEAEDLDADDARRLLKTLRYADDGKDPVYPDFYILESAADLVRDEWPGLAEELDLWRQKLINALDEVDEDGE